MSHIKTQLQELARHYASARAVGHTTALLEGAKNVPKCIVVAANQRDGEFIEELVGLTSDVMVIGLPGLRDGRLAGMARPVLLDNHAMLVLVSDALVEIERLEKENATLAAWKEEALAVEAQWDCQAIGKLLGVKLGDHIRPNIEPRVRALLIDLQRGKQIVREALDKMDHYVNRKSGNRSTGEHYPAIQSVMDKMRDHISRP